MSKNQPINITEHAKEQEQSTNIVPNLTRDDIEKMSVSRFKKHLKENPDSAFDTYSYVHKGTKTELTVNNINLFHILSAGTSTSAIKKRSHLLQKYPESNGLINAPDSQGKTPLHYASEYYFNMHTIEFLVRNGADIHAQDKTGNQAIHIAARNRLQDNIRTLCELRANINASNVLGETPLHLIFKGRPKKMTEPVHDNFRNNIEYIRNQGGSPNKQNTCGRTPLHYAVKNHHVVADILYQAYTSGLGKTEYRLPVFSFKWKHKHAPGGYEKINSLIKDNKGKLALDYLPNSGKPSFLQEQLKLDRDYRPYHISSKGETMFHRFARSFDPTEIDSNAATINFLLTSDKLDLNAADRNGNTGLHYLAQHTQALPQFEDFLAKAIHINALNAKGQTALHVAADHGHIKVVKQLIRAGADKSLLDKDGRTYKALLEEHKTNQDITKPTKKNTRSHAEEYKLERKDSSPSL